MASSKTAAKVAPSTAVAVKPENALVDASTAALFQQHAGGGFQHANKDSYAIPFLLMLQSMSPQTKKSDPAYIKGAEEGDFYDSVNGIVIAKGDEGVVVVPCFYNNSFVEWVTREKGGGFKGEHGYQQGVDLRSRCVRDEKNRDILPNGHQLNDTRNHAVLVLGEDGPQPFMLSMTSTQITKSKKWMTAMNNLKLKGQDGALFTPPMYGTQWRITSIAESNDKGSWSGFNITPEGYVADPAVFNLAKGFHDQVNSGVANIAPRAEDPLANGSTGVEPGSTF